MRLSVSEAIALLRKAAWGAGLPHGHADAFAAVTRVVGDRDDPFWYDMLRVIETSPSRNAPSAVGGVLSYENASAIYDGLVAIDEAICGQGVAVSGLDAPLVFARLVQVAEAEMQISLLVSASEGNFLLKARPLEDAQPQVLPPDRIVLPDDIYAKLTALAARTYVPESSQSRALGAGAGLDDND